jgi:hypothetical protein
MQFYLHLVAKGEIVTDEEGTDLPDVKAAIREAQSALREIVAAAIKAADDDAVPDAIIVTDGSGREIQHLLAASVIPRKLRG